MSAIRYPRIHLAIDNCFASKRWTSPLEWATVIDEELGLRCIEASADTENDPLYSSAQYHARWLSEVQGAQEARGVRVVNLYSGHGTYATLGLAHTDPSVREHLLSRWFYPMIDTAASLGAGMGFFAHAFPISTLDNAEQYGKSLAILYDNLAAVASYARNAGVGSVGVEQMYSPHQVPWTIQTTAELLRAVYERSKASLYVTIDVGHQCGQRRYVRPEKAMIADWLQEPLGAPPWVGTRLAHALLKQAAQGSRSEHAGFTQRIVDNMDEHPYLFATLCDSDPYAWLEQLGCWSPIVHLQQTDGTRSAHSPFTSEHNAGGIIESHRVLTALKKSYDSQATRLPIERCEDIYLTIEVFSGTADTPWQIVERVRETVAYWRLAVPCDGIALDELLKKGTPANARVAA